MSHGSWGGGGHVHVQLGSVHVEVSAKVVASLTLLACHPFARDSRAPSPLGLRSAPAERFGNLMVISSSDKDVDPRPPRGGQGLLAFLSARTTSALGRP